MWFDDLTKTFFAFNKHSSLSSGTCYTICNWWSLISPNSFTQEVREQPCGLRWVRTRPAHYESKSSIRYAIATKAPSSEIHSDKFRTRISVPPTASRRSDKQSISESEPDLGNVVTDFLIDVGMDAAKNIFLQLLLSRASNPVPSLSE